MMLTQLESVGFTAIILVFVAISALLVWMTFR